MARYRTGKPAHPFRPSHLAHAHTNSSALAHNRNAPSPHRQSLTMKTHSHHLPVRTLPQSLLTLAANLSQSPPLLLPMPQSHQCRRVSQFVSPARSLSSIRTAVRNLSTRGVSTAIPKRGCMRVKSPTEDAAHMQSVAGSAFTSTLARPVSLATTTGSAVSSAIQTPQLSHLHHLCCLRGTARGHPFSHRCDGTRTSGSLPHRLRSIERLHLDRFPQAP